MSIHKCLVYGLDEETGEVELTTITKDIPSSSGSLPARIYRADITRDDKQAAGQLEAFPSFDIHRDDIRDAVVESVTSDNCNMVAGPRVDLQVSLTRIKITVDEQTINELNRTKQQHVYVEPRGSSTNLTGIDIMIPSK